VMVSQLASYHLNQPSLSVTSIGYPLSKCHSGLTHFIWLVTASDGVREQVQAMLI